MALAAGDPLWYYKVLGLHCDGTNGSTTFTDVKGKTVTVYGNAQISTAQYPALTGKTSSAYFDGTGDYLSIPASTDFNFGTGDFTIRCRFYIAGNSAPDGGGLRNARLFCLSNGTTTFDLDVEIVGDATNTGTGISFYSSANGAFTRTTTVSKNVWHDIEVSRSGTSLRIFLDGTQLGATFTNSSAWGSSTSSAYIGGAVFSSNYYFYFNGYISEVEIYKGVATNTANYTPPSIPFPDTYLRISGETKNSSGTLSPRVVRVMRCSDNSLAGSVLSDYSTGQYVVTALDSTPHYAVCHSDLFDPYWSSTVLLMHMDSTGLTDEKGKTITLAGNAARSATESKFGGYSAYFDGTGDYLTTPDSADFAFGSGDFTIECYFKQGATGGTYALCAQRTNTTTSYSFAFQITGSTITFIGSTSGTGTTHTVTAAYTQETSNWHHAAVVRSGTVLTVFADGVPGTNVVIGATALFDSAAVLSIGGDTTGSSNQFNGYIDDLRITKGVARYTTTFTPHTAAHPHAYSATENAQIYDNITPY